MQHERIIGKPWINVNQNIFESKRVPSNHFRVFSMIQNTVTMFKKILSKDVSDTIESY